MISVERKGRRAVSRVAGVIEDTVVRTLPCASGRAANGQRFWRMMMRFSQSRV